MAQTDRPRLLVLQALGAIWAESYCPMLETLDVDLSFVYWKDMLGRPAREIAAMERYGEVVEVEDPAALAEVAIQYGRARGVDGVLTFSELLLRDAAAVADALGLPHHSPAAVEVMQRKDRQREALAFHGVPVPRFHRIRSDDDLGGALQHVPLPAVFKPVYGFGSLVTFRVDDASQLGPMYREARALYAQDPRVRGAEAVFLLEELLAGENWWGDPRFGDYVSVESLVHDGQVHHLTITDKLPLSPPFRETGDVMPSSLSAARQEQVLAMATRAIVSVGASNGAVHTEIKLTPQGPRIIEVNGRLGGCIGELLAEAGYNVVAEIGRVALGRSPLEQPAFRHYVSFLTPQTPAADVRVHSVSGLADIAELDGVRVVRSYLAEGTVPEWRRGGGLIASMRLSAPTLDDMLALQHRVLTTLQLEYGPACAEAA